MDCKKRSLSMKQLTIAFLTMMLMPALPTARPVEAADMPTMQQLEGAKTKADHEAIAAQYDALAAEAKSKATEHTEMAAMYKKLGSSGFGGGRAGQTRL